MQLVIKPERKHIYALGEDGLKDLDFQFLDEDFSLIFHKSKISIPREANEDFYDEFSKIFDNKYIFRDSLSYQRENEISWVSDEYNGSTDKLEEQNRLIMTRNFDSIDFAYKNESYEKSGIKKGLSIVLFSPYGMGRYSRNVSTGSSLQEDMLNTFNNLLNSYEKKNQKK